MLKKLLLVLVLLALVGGAGFGAWWALGATDRKLAELKSQVWTPDEDWAWLDAHASDPRVQALVRANFQMLVGKPSTADDARKKLLDHYGVFWKAHPPVMDDELMGLVTRGVVMSAYPAIGDWFSDWSASPVATAELRAELDDMTKTYYTWDVYPDLVVHQYDTIEAELDRRQVPEDDARVAAETRVSLRYAYPRAVALVKRLGSDPRVTAACVAHLEYMASENNYRAVQGEVELTMQAVAERRPEPTDALFDALFRYGSNPATDAVVKTWSPSVLPRLTKRRDGLTDDWLKTQASQLLARCGAGGAADVAPILEELERWLPEPLPAWTPDDDLPPTTPFFEPLEWGKTKKTTIDRSLASLVAIGPAGVEALEIGLRGRRRETVHVAAQALARVDGKALIAEIRTALALFDPLARKVAELPMGQPLPKDFLGLTYTTEGRVVAEGLAALPDAKGVSDEDVVSILRDAVSCPEPMAAEGALDALSKRLDTAHFVPGLFTSLASKTRFSHGEVDTYVKAITARTDSGPALERALEKLLEAAGGSPERIPTIHKIVALRAIAAVGTKSAVAVLEKYAKDTGSYQDVTTTYDKTTMRPTKIDATDRTFAELAKQALERARSR